ncbi:hypothetical protein [Microbacterium sp. NPDC087589]|uniref:hypothetical protein n=1 Tax=Microbacterium sp. NPDC087589 TaxID=3364191 RepID=UPI0037F7BB83
MKAIDLAALAQDSGDPRRGLRAVATLRQLVESMELAQVEAALRAGMSWQEIAEELKVSRQAVHRKYSNRVDENIPIPRRKRR